MSQDRPIQMAKAVELLFNDSSRNVADLKSRQWTATNLGVLTIMAIALFAREHTRYAAIATVLMFLVAACQFWVTYKCHRNLDTFRTRIKTLIGCYFTEESHKLFEKGKAGWVPAEEGKPPKGKEGQDFEDAVVDEGSIETTLFVTAPVTLMFACFVVWCWH